MKRKIEYHRVFEMTRIEPCITSDPVQLVLQGIFMDAAGFAGACQRLSLGIIDLEQSDLFV